MWVLERAGAGRAPRWGNGRSCGAGQGASKDFWLGLLWGSPCGLVFTWGSQDYSCLGPWQELWLPGHGLWSGIIPPHGPPQHRPVKTEPDPTESMVSEPCLWPWQPRTPEKGQRRRLRLWCQGEGASRWEGGSVSCPRARGPARRPAQCLAPKHYPSRVWACGHRGAWSQAKRRPSPPGPAHPARSSPEVRAGRSGREAGSRLPCRWPQVSSAGSS